MRFYFIRLVRYFYNINFLKFLVEHNSRYKQSANALDSVKRYLGASKKTEEVLVNGHVYLMYKDYLLGEYSRKEYIKK